jgi:type VI secretion system protein ImpH
MATEERRPDALLTTVEELGTAAPRLGFFAVVALLERLSTGAARVGETGPADAEAIRFRHDPSLAFSASDVSALSVAGAGDADDAPRPPVVEVLSTFLGLTGSVTPLPPYLAEEVAGEDPDRAHRRDFLDVFHHRALSLFYRIQARYDLASEYTSGELDRWARRVLALAGLDAYTQLPVSTLPSWRLLRLAPLLARRSRTARMLEVALEDVLEEELQGARVTVRQFVGTWAELPDAQLMRLGRSTAALGRTGVLGRKVFNPAGKIVIRIGPLSRDAHRRFLPEGELAPVVNEVVRLVLRDPLEIGLELWLLEAAPFALSVRGEARLGRDTLIGTGRKQAELRMSAA